jgi:hypothetical protein
MSIRQQLTALEGLSLEWQMTNCERYALTGLLELTRPEISLEIGTYRGGSLQVLSHFSKKVLSIDIDPTVATRLSGKFDNVEFCIGDSKDHLPNIIHRLNSESTPIEFVLIDGDHSEQGVRRDINTLLEIIPKKRIVVILHDSFNPDCRRGMRSASWSSCKYVHFVELDFIPGVYHEVAFDTAEARTMWGGFACAVLEPHSRVDELVVKETQKGLYESVYLQSSHSLNQFGRKSLIERLFRRSEKLL